MRSFTKIVGAVLLLALAAPARAYWPGFFGQAVTQTITNSGSLSSVGPNTLNGGTQLIGGTTVQNSLYLPVGSTLTVAGASNVQLFLSSQAVTAGGSLFFNLAVPSSSTVDCTFDALWNTSAGQMQVQFSSSAATGIDGGNNYLDNGLGQTQSVGVTSVAHGPAGNIQPQRTAVLAGRKTHLHFHYQTDVQTETQVDSQANYENSASQWENNVGGWSWLTGGPPILGKITASAGTMTGFIRCTYTAW